MGCSNPYNGFAGKERDQAWALQLAARDRGEVSWSVPCCMCSGVGGMMMPHNEDYDRPLDFFPLCVACHMRLHVRFRAPTVWLWHLEGLTRGLVPRQYGAVFEYFKANRRFRYPLLEGRQPSEFGTEWYHGLLMEPVDVRAPNGWRPPLPPAPPPPSA